MSVYEARGVREHSLSNEALNNKLSQSPRYGGIKNGYERLSASVTTAVAGATERGGGSTNEPSTIGGECVVEHQVGEGEYVGRADRVIVCPVCGSTEDRLYMRLDHPTLVNGPAEVSWCPCGAILHTEKDTTEVLRKQ